MKVGDKEYKTAFFLGAGASRGAIDHIVLNRKRIKPPLNTDFFKVAETYARAKGNKSAAQKRLTRLLRVFKRDLPSRGYPTMEDAFSLLYIAKDFPEIYNQGPGRRPAAGVRKEISDFLNLLFPILASLDDENNDETGYDRLALTLTSDDALVTLNYDTLLDSALYRRGWDPRIGYAISGNAAKRTNWFAVTQGDPSLEVKLLKLHGSMNWFVRGQTSNLKKVFSSKPVSITKPRFNEISGHIRQIAPPIYGKIFEHSHWQNLWTSAFRALCDAEVIVVIGCSLIDTDFHLRALLSQVARTRKQQNNKFQYAILVDKSVVVRRKWKTVLRGSFKEAIEYNELNKLLNLLGV
jgi:hypothetical protein